MYIEKNLPAHSDMQRTLPTHLGNHGKSLNWLIRACHSKDYLQIMSPAKNNFQKEKYHSESMCAPPSAP
jgi:hypothetical protein